MQKGEKYLIIIYTLVIFMIGFLNGAVWQDFRSLNNKDEAFKITKETHKLELQTEKAICEAKIIDTVIKERIRLTGKPNP